MKKQILKFFQIIFVAIVCLTFAGCMGSDPDNPDSEAGVSLLGVKVLRKPLSYDFEGNVPENEGEVDFYRHFANNIITQLFAIYGNFNYFGLIAKDENGTPLFDNIFKQINSQSQNAQVGELAAMFEQNPDQFVYFYDAIRYQTTSVEEDAQSHSYTITVDASKAWNWSVSQDNTNYNMLPLAYNGSQQGNLIKTTFESKENEVPSAGSYSLTYNSFNYYYSGQDQEYYTFIPLAYQSAFINEDYIDALTYTIYSLVLGLEPNEMTVSYDGGEPTLTVVGYGATAEKSSAALALEDVKITFNQLGSYVGLTQRNKDQIVDFVLEEVIGQAALSMPTNINPTFKYDFYYEDVVTAIVDYCGSLTTIGNENQETGEGSTTVGGSFMASEVVNYPVTSFFSMLEGDPFAYTGAYEYQSVVLMPDVSAEKPVIRITDLWLDFKYDANEDGDEIYDPTKSITIEVILRWNKGDGSPIKEAKQSITVPDGPIDVGEDGWFLEFELERDDLFGEVVELGAFNCPEALNPPEGERLLTLTGLSDARRYYKVMESATYGGYGVLDETKIAGSYLEIAYNVEKAPGDTTTNYAFYTAISNLGEEATWPGSPEWH